MPNPIQEDSPSVQAHLGILQGVIQRMASNSVSSKAWCITLVSAILVVVAGQGNSKYALIALIPTVLFLVLDAYYLALERAFIESYNSFVRKLHEQQVESSDLYAVKPTGNLIRMTFKAPWSFSVWPFYLTLVVMILVVKEFVIN